MDSTDLPKSATVFGRSLSSLAFLSKEKIFKQAPGVAPADYICVSVAGRRDIIDVFHPLKVVSFKALIFRCDVAVQHR